MERWAEVMEGHGVGGPAPAAGRLRGIIIILL